MIREIKVQLEYDFETDKHNKIINEVKNESTIKQLNLMINNWMWRNKTDKVNELKKKIKEIETIIEMNN